MEGGAGSGKSISIRFDAYMRALATPGFKALILRRSYPELQLSHLQHVPFDVKRLGLPPDAYHKTEYTVRIKHPNGPDGKPQPDSIVVFGHVESDETIAKYLSSEWEAIYFDELCTFTLRQFLFLSSRARTKIPGLRAIVRGGTNPIGPGASWVRRFFITKQVKYDEAPDYDPNEFLALHSTVRDNKHIDQVEYLRRLRALPSEALRKAMDTGEWTLEGQFFSEWREEMSNAELIERKLLRIPLDLSDADAAAFIGTLRPWHVIHEIPRVKGKPIPEVPWISIVRVLDWGYSADGNPGCCLWFACLPDGTVIAFHEYLFKQTLPKDAAKEIIRQSRGMKISYTVGDPAMWREHVGESIAETFAKHGVSMVDADNERIPGWVQVHYYLRDTVDDGTGPRPRLQVYVGPDGDGCPTLARTMPEMVIDPKNPEDVLTRNVEDDGPDCVRYFAQSRPSPSKESGPGMDPNLRYVMAYIKHKQAKTRRWSNANRRRAA